MHEILEYPILKQDPILFLNNILYVFLQSAPYLFSQKTWNIQPLALMAYIQ